MSDPATFLTSEIPCEGPYLSAKCLHHCSCGIYGYYRDIKIIDMLGFYACSSLMNAVKNNDRRI